MFSPPPDYCWWSIHLAVLVFALALALFGFPWLLPCFLPLPYFFYCGNYAKCLPCPALLLVASAERPCQAYLLTFLFAALVTPLHRKPAGSEAKSGTFALLQFFLKLNFSLPAEGTPLDRLSYVRLSRIQAVSVGGLWGTELQGRNFAK